MYVASEATDLYFLLLYQNILTNLLSLILSIVLILVTLSPCQVREGRHFQHSISVMCPSLTTNKAGGIEALIIIG